MVSMIEFSSFLAGQLSLNSANQNSLVMFVDSNYIIDDFLEVKDSSQQEMLSEILHFSSEKSL